MLKQYELILLIAPAAGVLVWLIERGMTTGVPPGQKGLLGTSMASSKKLWTFQMIVLALFLCLCVGSIVWLLTW